MRAERWLLFAVAWLSAALFLQREPGWNVNSRLALTYAIVDEHRLTIDTFHSAQAYSTGDKALFEDHFYSDKAIGNALTAVPIYQLARWTGLPLSANAKRYLCRAFTVSLAFGLLLVVLAGLIERQGVSPRDATLLAAMGGMGTMLFPFATLFLPYAPACLFAMLAYRLTLPRALDGPLEALPLPRILLAGLSMGISMLFENLFGLIALFLVAHLLVSQRPFHRGIGAAALFTAGALIALIPFFLYTWAIFGRFAIPYEYEHDPFFREAMASGFMGIHLPPRPSILWLITLHPFRGLFVYSPLLLMAIPGLIAFTRLPRGGWRALMCGGIFVGYLIVNGGYTHQWWGGWSCGPRHLIPAIPFLLLAVGAAWGQWRWIRPVIVVLGVLSVALQLLAAGVDPQPPTPVPGGDANAYLAHAQLDLEYPVPLTTWWLPLLREGVVAWNPGTLMGISELWMWGVLILIWVGYGIWARVRNSEQKKQPLSRNLD